VFIVQGEERESQNVLEILKQFHLTGDYGEASPLDTVSASGDSSSAESRNGSAGSGDADVSVRRQSKLRECSEHRPLFLLVVKMNKVLFCI
jgi:hypothetical protein